MNSLYNAIASRTKRRAIYITVGDGKMAPVFGNEIDGFKEGAKVRYIKGWHACVGWNQVYIISKVEVGSYYTDIFLEGDDMPYNSVDFEVVEEE